MTDRAFHRLHPHLRHGIIHDLGWDELRPVQQETIDAILDGCNAVVLAPTAGGKTEASIFPTLSQILSEDRKPVCALYLCPVRALLNNQEARVQKYARMVGLDAFKWHGDVPESARKAFRAEPAHILMTTPESIEVMLLSSKTDAVSLFNDLSMVIVDEVHAFAGDDRGAHLVALLERISSFCERDIQRIGLSATVGNPDAIGDWLQGSSQRPFRLVDPPKPLPRRQLHIELYEDLLQAAPEIAQLGLGKKSLVFVESRSGAEKVSRSLRGRGVEVFVHHGSISREDRERAEAMFERGQNTAIVATSTMELGIDVGDLHQVMQIGAPSTVAGFLQRIGRTGRREGSVSNCRFYCMEPEVIVHAAALLRLADAGWVEDVKPVRRAWHILAHQILALTLQQGGVSRHRVLSWVGAATPFADLTEAESHELTDTMVERGILDESNGLLSLGLQGEKVYGRRNFFELYAVFSAPPLLKVLNGRNEVGTVDTLFVGGHDHDAGPLCFRLAGRAWKVVRQDLKRGRLYVEPTEGGKIPSWLGQGGMLSYALCQEMKHTLRSEGPEVDWLGPRAAEELAALRLDYDGLVDPDRAPLELRGSKLYWHTFAGGNINRMLAAALEHGGTGKWIVGNRVLRWDGGTVSAAQAAIGSFDEMDFDEVASALGDRWMRGELSKFDRCLPDHAVAELMMERLLDAEGARGFLAGHRVPVVLG